MEAERKKRHVALPAALAAALLLFLIPARFVAYETVEMVNTVVLTLLVLAAVLLMMVLTVAAVLRHRSSARMVFRSRPTCGSRRK